MIVYVCLCLVLYVLCYLGLAPLVRCRCLCFVCWFVCCVGLVLNAFCFCYVCRLLFAVYSVLV